MLLQFQDSSINKTLIKLNFNTYFNMHLFSVVIYQNVVNYLGN